MRGKCGLCKKPAWINTASWKEKVFIAGQLHTFYKNGELCAECFETHSLIDNPGCPTIVNDRSWQNNNNPGLDNVIREMEEDR